MFSLVYISVPPIPITHGTSALPQTKITSKWLIHLKNPVELIQTKMTSKWLIHLNNPVELTQKNVAQLIDTAKCVRLHYIVEYKKRGSSVNWVGLRWGYKIIRYKTPQIRNDLWYQWISHPTIIDATESILVGKCCRIKPPDHYCMYRYNIYEHTDNALLVR